MSYPITAKISSTISRLGSSFLMATGITLVLLWVMTQLIGRFEVELTKHESVTVPSFTYEATEPEVEINKPKPPELPDDKPAIVRDRTILVNDPLAVTLDDSVFQPTRDVDLKPQLVEPGGAKLIPITAEYPAAALRRGMCGEVLVQFDVSPKGFPENIQIIESSSSIFNRSATKAVSKYRFKPFTDGGKPVWVTGKQEKVTYILDEGCG